jgi:hypothetical protein
MTEVRNPTESAARAWLAGQPRPASGSALAPGASETAKLTPEQFEQVAREVLATLPDGPQLFVRGEARRAYADAVFAGACLESADQTPAAEALQALANARRSAMARAMATLPESRATANIPLPPHRFEPLPAQQAWLDTAAPLPIAQLPAPWHVVSEVSQGQLLLRHPDHALAWATTDAQQHTIISLRAVTGHEALTALLNHGFQLEDPQKQRLRAAAQLGTRPPRAPDLEAVLAAGLADGRSRSIVELRHPSHRMRLVEVETRSPRYRAGLVAFFLNDDGGVIGLRFIDGADGYEMMGLADAAAPTLPGADGTPPEAELVTEANAQVERIAANAIPTIEAMIRGPDGVEAVRPKVGDAARVFAPEFAAEAEARYLALWQQDTPKLKRANGSITLKMSVCPAGFFGSENPLAAAFPEGYARMAPKLNPHAVWVGWSYDVDGRAAKYDGLVWVQDDAGGGRWVWFPAVWRVL